MMTPMMIRKMMPIMENKPQHGAPVSTREKEEGRVVRGTEGASAWSCGGEGGKGGRGNDLLAAGQVFTTYSTRLCRAGPSCRVVCRLAS